MLRRIGIVVLALVAACGPQIELEPPLDTGGDGGTAEAEGSSVDGGPSTTGANPSTSSGGADEGAPFSTVTTDPTPTTMTTGPMSTTGTDPVDTEGMGGTEGTEGTGSGDTIDEPGGCDPPCLPGQECIAGLCFGEPDDTGVCPGPPMEGNYADCIDTMPCDGGVCVSDNAMMPTGSACVVLGCLDVCDCPDPGDLDGALVCDVITADEQHGCYFACDAGAECPPGMVCLGGFFCAWPA